MRIPFLPGKSSKNLKRISQLLKLEQGILAVGPDIQRRALDLRNLNDDFVKLATGVQNTAMEMKDIAPRLQGKKTDPSNAAAMKDLRRWGELYAETRGAIELLANKMQLIYTNAHNMRIEMENIRRLISEINIDFNKSDAFLRKEQGKFEQQVNDIRDCNNALNRMTERCLRLYRWLEGPKTRKNSDRWLSRLLPEFVQAVRRAKLTTPKGKSQARDYFQELGAFGNNEYGAPASQMEAIKLTFIDLLNWFDVRFARLVTNAEKIEKSLKEEVKIAA